MSDTTNRTCIVTEWMNAVHQATDQRMLTDAIMPYAKRPTIAQVNEENRAVRQLLEAVDELKQDKCFGCVASETCKTLDYLHEIQSFPLHPAAALALDTLIKFE